MSDKYPLTLRTITRDRKADITAPSDVTVRDLIADVCEKWNLSNKYEYVMRCERMGAQLAENLTLVEAGVQAGDVLEIQPLADAG